ncbi:hypothetical protein EVAR_49972_1 [Eumeta japonica]|uniref:Uncharacterized protein n=1 Tax=Eumeta variegata TaxID=151549 RepID=A0A4C1YP93_EUMVA|nr:hypothetical protein EVAR_49972_1 [Eumeta japonica]
MAYQKIGTDPADRVNWGVEACIQKSGLMMEPEGKHRNSIMKQRILALFGFVEIVLRCTLTMNDFQGLMMQLEGSDNGAGSLEAPSSDPESQSWSKSISGRFQQAQICAMPSVQRVGRRKARRGIGKFYKRVINNNLETDVALTLRASESQSSKKVRQFQHRGSLYCYILLRLENAPAVEQTKFANGKNVPKTLELIDDLCTVDVYHPLWINEAS